MPPTPRVTAAAGRLVACFDAPPSANAGAAANAASRTLAGAGPPAAIAAVPGLLPALVRALRVEAYALAAAALVHDLSIKGRERAYALVTAAEGIVPALGEALAFTAAASEAAGALGNIVFYSPPPIALAAARAPVLPALLRALAAAGGDVAPLAAQAVVNITHTAPAAAARAAVRPLVAALGAGPPRVAELAAQALFNIVASRDPAALVELASAPGALAALAGALDARRTRDAAGAALFEITHHCPAAKRAAAADGALWARLAALISAGGEGAEPAARVIQKLCWFDDAAAKPAAGAAAAAALAAGAAAPLLALAHSGRATQARRSAAGAVSNMLGYNHTAATAARDPAIAEGLSRLLLSSDGEVACSAAWALAALMNNARGEAASTALRVANAPGALAAATRLARTARGQSMEAGCMLLSGVCTATVQAVPCAILPGGALVPLAAVATDPTSLAGANRAPDDPSLRVAAEPGCVEALAAAASKVVSTHPGTPNPAWRALITLATLPDVAARIVAVPGALPALLQEGGHAYTGDPQWQSMLEEAARRCMRAAPRDAAIRACRILLGKRAGVDTRRRVRALLTDALGMGEEEVAAIAGAHAVRAMGGEQCAACGTASGAAELKRCARCKMVAYCGADCQRADWPAHRAACRAASAAAAGGAPMAAGAQRGG